MDIKFYINFRKANDASEGFTTACGILINRRYLVVSTETQGGLVALEHHDCLVNGKDKSDEYVRKMIKGYDASRYYPGMQGVIDGLRYGILEEQHLVHACKCMQSLEVGIENLLVVNHSFEPLEQRYLTEYAKGISKVFSRLLQDELDKRSNPWGGPLTTEQLNSLMVYDTWRKLSKAGVTQ